MTWYRAWVNEDETEGALSPETDPERAQREAGESDLYSELETREYIEVYARDAGGEDC
jgi:hypothetical protein